MKTLDWTALRPHKGTQHAAFEELCCQLASREAVPPGSIFHRLGTPDGGVEGYHRDPSGDEWGFQAKFIQSLGESQLDQIDGSVKRALHTHPKLKRLTICMPIDLPDPRGPNISATDRWNKRVEKWKRWAADLDRDVNFDKWGEFEIRDRLTKAEHHGRLHYWFSKEVLTQVWFEQRAGESVASAGKRYTPDLHVGLQINNYFESLGRTPTFSLDFRKLEGSILRVAQRLSNASVPEAAEAIKAEVLSNTQALGKELAATAFETPVVIRQDDLARMAKSLLELVTALRNVLDENRPLENEGHPKDPFANAQHELRNLSSALYQLERRLDGREVEVANARCLLVCGPPGAGKTHLLADVNNSRIARGMPSVLVMGQKFTNREPLSQIVELLRFPGSTDEFLGALDASAEAAGTLATILIDALNEGDGTTLWPMSLAGLITAVKAHPRLCIAISVRSTYKSVVIPDEVNAQVVRVDHHGFGEKTFEAVTRYFANYSIKIPGAPISTSEFSNPLFLKLFCEGLSRNGITEVPVGHEGITKIFSFFLDAVEATLKRAVAKSEPPFKNLTRPYLQTLAEAMAETAEAWLDEPKAYSISEECAPRMVGDNALLYHLIREGVLAKEMVYTGDDYPVEVIRFAYERVGDHALVESLLAGKDEEQVRDLFTENGKIGERLRRPGRYMLNGFLEAAMIHIPEKFGFELIDVLSWVKGYYRQPIEDAFLHSMVWRRTDAFTTATWNSVRVLNQTTNEQFLNVLLVLATRRGHAYNADFLHARLLAMSVAERDVSWTIIINRSYDEGTTTDLLIRWTRSFLDSQVLDAESAQLLAITLTWFLTSTHQILRDKATKSLVRVFSLEPNIVPQLLSDFTTCNDPYVLERLYAAVYGAAMLMHELEVLQAWALTVRTHMALGSFPISLLTRDYARGVVERAVAAGVPLPDEMLSSVRPPYGSAMPKRIPTASFLAAKSQFHFEMSDAERVEAHIYDQSPDDFMERYYGAKALRVDMFSQVRLSRSLPMHPEKRLSAFEHRLAGSVAEQFAESKHILQELHHFTLPTMLKRPGKSRKRVTNEQIDAAIKDFSQKLGKQLPVQERREFRNFIVPYLSRKGSWPEAKQMESDLVRRWITHRSLRLGWTKQKFGEHDGWCFRLRKYGLSERPVGLIAHKYRWIAYDEFLARAADNYHLLDRYGQGTNVYDGPWQLDLRDVDPSFIHPGKPTTNEEDADLNTLSAGESFEDWLATESDLPTIKSIVLPNHSEWITLDCCPVWSEPLRPEEEISSRDTYRTVRYWIHGYFVRTEHVDEVCSFLQTVRFSNYRMPEGGDLRDIFFGELYWSPAWRSKTQPESGWGYEDWTHGSLPHSVLATCWSYFAPDDDKSFDGSAFAAVPAPWFATTANLRWSGHLAEWTNADNIVVARDPTLQSGGIPRLEVNRIFLESYLAKESMELIWTFQGEKIIMDSGRYPYTELDGCYRYIKGGDISGKHSNLGDARQ